MRKGELENLVLKGKIDGKKGKGRPSTTFMSKTAARTNKTELELLRTTKDRDLWEGMIANVLRGHDTKGGAQTQSSCCDY